MKTADLEETVIFEFCVPKKIQSSFRLECSNAFQNEVYNLPTKDTLRGTNIDHSASLSL